MTHDTACRNGREMVRTIIPKISPAAAAVEMVEMARREFTSSMPPNDSIGTNRLIQVKTVRTHTDH